MSFRIWKHQTYEEITDGFNATFFKGNGTFENDIYAYLELSPQAEGRELLYIIIEGPDTVFVNSPNQYHCHAYYNDGSDEIVPNPCSVIWNDNCDNANIDNVGLFTASNTNTAVFCQISAEYTDNGIMKDTIFNVTIMPDPRCWTATIYVEGEQIEGNAFQDSIEVGVCTMIDTIPKPPEPFGYTVLIDGYWTDWSGPYLTNIRQIGMESYCWIIVINPHGNVPPPDSRCAILSWDPNKFDPDTSLTYALFAGDDCSDSILIPDMRIITEYEVCGGDTPQYFTIKVTVDDTESPVALCQDVELYADENCASEASIDAGSYDPEGQEITLDQVPAGPYALGETLVTLIVTDTDGLSDSCEGLVTVVDTTSPVVICPDAITVDNALGECGAVVSFEVSATDNCSLDVVVAPESGSFFPIGTTTVSVTATDGSGNESTCSFDVTVDDTESPVALCPGDTTIYVNPDVTDVMVEFTSSVEDNCPGATISCEPSSGSFFGVGTTEVTCTAEDASGNTSQCSFIITVVIQDSENKYVNCELGDDSGLGTIEDPYQSISYALSQTGACDTVFVFSGDCYESFEIDQCVSIIALNEPGETVIHADADNRCLNIENVTDTDTVFLKGLSFTDGAPDTSYHGGQAGAIRVSASNVIIDSCNIYGNESTGAGGGICFRDGSHFEIHNSCISHNISNSSGGGFSSIDCSVGIVTRTAIHGNTSVTNGGGAFYYASSDNAGNDFIMLNNVLSSNGGGMRGAAVEANRADLDFRNNIVTNNYNTDPSNTVCAVYVSNSLFEDNYNDYFGNLTDCIQNAEITIGATSIFDDPMIVGDSANCGFSLNTCSPCVDAGDPGIDPLPDGGTRSDIGIEDVVKCQITADTLFLGRPDHACALTPISVPIYLNNHQPIMAGTIPIALSGIYDSVWVNLDESRLGYMDSVEANVDMQNGRVTIDFTANMGTGKPALQPVDMDSKDSCIGTIEFLGNCLIDSICEISLFSGYDTCTYYNQIDPVSLLVVDTAGQEHIPAVERLPVFIDHYRPGDANSDCIFNVTDCVWIIDWVFNIGSLTPYCQNAIDCNGDCITNVSDAQYCVFSIFVPGFPLPLSHCSQPVLAKTGLFSQAEVISNSVHKEDQIWETEIYVENYIDIYAMQFDFQQPTDIELLGIESDLYGYELYHGFKDDKLKIGLLDIDNVSYIGPGTNDIIKLRYKSSDQLILENAILCNKDGRSIGYSMGQASAVVPEMHSLQQNIPNPFNPYTEINYEIGQDADVNISIYNLLGEKVRTLVDNHHSAGPYKVEWDGCDDYGKPLASGMYFYKMVAEDYKETKKMILLK